MAETVMDRAHQYLQKNSFTLNKRVMFWLLTPTVHVITLQCEEFEKKMQYENPMNGLKKTKIGYTNTVYSETCAIWQNLSYKQFLLQFITKGKSFS